MADHERAMLLYVKLAELSQQKSQLPGRDKFLVLAASSACRAGWPAVAERCRALVLLHNRAHLVGHCATFVDTMRSADFEPFLRQLERFCSFEKAEHLLAELNIDVSPPQPGSNQSAGEYALAMLADND